MAQTTETQRTGHARRQYVLLLAVCLTSLLPAWADLSILNITPDSETGRPRWVMMRMSDPAIQPARTRANNVLRGLPAAAGMAGIAANLSVWNEHTSPTGRHLRYEQRYQGLRVVGGEVAVHFLDGDQVLVRIDALPGVSLPSVTPSLDADAALAACRAALENNGGGPVVWGDVYRRELVVFPAEDGPHLAYEIRLGALAPDFDWITMVDAHSGELLHASPLRLHVTGQGRIFNPNAVRVLGDNTLLDHSNANLPVFGPAYSTVTLYGLDGTGRLRGDFVSTVGSLNDAYSATHDFLYTRDNDRFEQTMVYYFIDTTQRMIQQLGYYSINNRRLQAYVNSNSAGNPYTADQSFYSPNGSGTGYLQFGSGGVDDAEDADIILHEYWHAIQDNIIPDFALTATIGFSLAEAYADAWSVNFTSEISGLPLDPCVGNWDARGYSPPDTCLRRIDGAQHYPANFNGASLSARYVNSLIWSNALYRVRKQLGFEPFTRAFVESQHYLARLPPDFRDGAVTWMIADERLYGYRHEHVLRLVFEARGLADPLPFPGGLAHANDTPLTVAANDVDGATSTLTVSEDVAIAGMRLYARLDRQQRELDQLVLTLVSPQGTSAQVYNGPGDADPLTVFNGESSAGVWQLHVVDVAAHTPQGKSSSLAWWGLSFEVQQTGAPRRLYLGYE